MTFKHGKFDDSAVLRSLERVAVEKGLIKPEVMVKSASSIVEKNDFTITDNISYNIMKLCSKLRDSGFSKHADDIEINYLKYKKAQTLYETFNEKGEDLVNAAHPDGSHELEGVEGDAKFLTIIDKHLAIVRMLDKKPTGKLASSKYKLKKKAAGGYGSITQQEADMALSKKLGQNLPLTLDSLTNNIKSLASEKLDNQYIITSVVNYTDAIENIKRSLESAFNNRNLYQRSDPIVKNIFNGNDIKELDKLVATLQSKYDTIISDLPTNPKDKETALKAMDSRKVAIKNIVESCSYFRRELSNVEVLLKIYNEASNEDADQRRAREEASAKRKKEEKDAAEAPTKETLEKQTAENELKTIKNSLNELGSITYGSNLHLYIQELVNKLKFMRTWGNLPKVKDNSKSLEFINGKMAYIEKIFTDYRNELDSVAKNIQKETDAGNKKIIENTFTNVIKKYEELYKKQLDIINEAATKYEANKYTTAPGAAAPAAPAPAAPAAPAPAAPAAGAPAAPAADNINLSAKDGKTNIKNSYYIIKGTNKKVNLPSAVKKNDVINKQIFFHAPGYNSKAVNITDRTSNNLEVTLSKATPTKPAVQPTETPTTAPLVPPFINQLKEYKPQFDNLGRK